MFEIKIADHDMSSGSIPITWCISPDLVQEMKEKNPNPQVVITVIPKHMRGNYLRSWKYDEKRYVAPLKDMIFYLPFFEPGTHSIIAFIYNATADRLLTKGEGQYYTDLFYYDSINQVHELEDHSILKQFNITGEPSNIIEVDVPQSFFAKKPFDYKWVTWLLSERPQDECNLRRKRMFAYTFQLLPYLMSICVKTCGFLIFLLFGLKGWKYKRFGLDVDTEDALNGAGEGSYFSIGKPEQTASPLMHFAYDVANTFLKFLTPIGILTISLATFYPLILLSAGIVFVVLFSLTMAILYNFHLEKFWNKLFPTKSEEKFFANDPKVLQALLCGEGKMPLTYKTIPNKTIKLRFQNLKSKVCKPFAR